MTLTEFKSWLHGFCEGIGTRAPNESEWKKIRKMIDGIQASPAAIETIREKIMPVIIRDMPNPISPFVQPLWPQPSVIWCQTSDVASGIHANYSHPVNNVGVIANGIN